MSESAVAVVPGPEDVLSFWFEEAGQDRWFNGGEAFDAEIHARFGPLHERVAAEFPDAWLDSRQGVLAGIIVLDQFSRNLHRGNARAFASDTDALNLTNLAIERGWEGDYGDYERAFLYMPFMHAEDMRAQDRSVELYKALGLPEQLKFAHLHRDVIARFGRYPARNAALGRDTTPAEQAYLDAGGGF